MPALDKDPSGINNTTAYGKIRSIKIYSLNGIKVAETDRQDGFSGLRPGIYTMRITTDKGISTRNIVIRGRQ